MRLYGSTELKYYLILKLLEFKSNCYCRIPLSSHSGITVAIFQLLWVNTEKSTSTELTKKMSVTLGKITTESPRS